MMAFLTGEALVQLLFASAFTGTIYALAAVSLNLLYSTMRFVNIAAGDFIMVGAYVAYWDITLYGISPLASLAVSFVILAAIGIALYTFIFRRLVLSMRTPTEVEYPSLLIFFGFVLILQNLASFVWGSSYRSYAYDIPIPYVNARLFTIIFVAGVVGVLSLFMARTWIGRTITYVIQNSQGAAIVGVEVSRVYILVLLLAFALAGMVGTLVSMNFVITPFIGLQYTMAGFVVMVFGGIGKMSRALPAGIVLGVVETFGTYFTSPAFRIIITYSFFLILMILRKEALLR
jgi:branched-chain amino acid transport system permease protein